MNIIISNANDQPIYEQICQQLQSAIIAGELVPGDALPSIRALAKDLRISVITTKRAYDELERDGFINTVAGKGCYVAQKDIRLIREGNLRQMEGHMRAALRLAPSCALTEAEILEMFRLIIEEEKEQ